MPIDNIDTSDRIGSDPNGTVIDPGTIGASVAAEPERGTRKRRADAGKPRGSTGPRATTKAQGVALDLSSITGLFVGLHALLANATNIPELEISDDEAKEFAKAAQNVARHYSVQTTQKTLDWIALVGVTAALYGPRIAAVGFRRRSERKPVPSDGNVVHIRDPYNGIQPHDFNGNGAAE